MLLTEVKLFVTSSPACQQYFTIWFWITTITFFSIKCMWPIYSLKYFFTCNPYIFSTEVCAFSETHPIPGQGWWKCQVFLLSMQWMEKALPPPYFPLLHILGERREKHLGGFGYTCCLKLDAWKSQFSCCLW